MLNFIVFYEVTYNTGEFIEYEFNNVRYYGRILAFVQIEENGYFFYYESQTNDYT